MNAPDAGFGDAGAGGPSLESRVARLESDVAGIRIELGEIRSDIREMRSDIGDLRGAFARMEGKLDIMIGRAPTTLQLMAMMLTTWAAGAGTVGAIVGFAR